MNDFIEILVPSKYIKDELLKVSERAHIPSTSVELIYDLKIPLPNIKIQKEIIADFKAIQQTLSDLKKMKIKANQKIQKIINEVWGMELKEPKEEKEEVVYEGA